MKKLVLVRLPPLKIFPLSSSSLPMAAASPILSSSPHLTLLYPPSSASPPSCGIRCPRPQKRSSATLQLVLGTSSSSSKLQRWRTGISFFPSFSVKKRKDPEALKKDLLDAIAPLDRGAEATDEDKERVDELASELESVSPIKEPLKSELLNGKWELLYTTSKSILQPQRPKLLRPNGKIYQAINVDTLRAQNMETWPYFNQVTANLIPLNSRRVAVRFDTFKILGLIPIKAPGRGRGELEITYLDEELRISRGDKGNLFILMMVDPSYRVPV